MAHLAWHNRAAVLAVTLCVIGVACGSQPASPPPNDKKAAEPAQGAAGTNPAAPTASTESKGVELVLVNTDPTLNGPRKPRLLLKADTATIGNDGMWSLNKAHALVYGREAEQSQMTMDAAAGQFKEGDMAYLSGGVSVQATDMKITLQDITWKNSENTAWSDNPVSIDSTRLALKASGLRIDPDAKTMQLTDATGTIEMGELAQ